MNSIIVVMLWAAGALACVLAGIALIRFPDAPSRLIGSTKLVTMGTALIFCAAAVAMGWNMSIFKALLCLGAVILSSSLEAHVLARAMRRRAEATKTEAQA